MLRRIALCAAMLLAACTVDEPRDPLTLRGGGDDDDSVAVTLGSVAGTVLAPTGAFVPGVTLRVGGLEATSDARGWFQIDRVPTGDQVLSASRDGWTSSWRPVDVRPDVTVQVSLALQPAAIRTLADPAPGPDAVVTQGGVTVEFIEGSFTYEESGEVVAGPIDVAIALLDEPNELHAAPGMLAVGDGGEPFALESFGMVEVVLTAGGARVRFAGRALLSFPLFAGHPFSDGDPIPLWSFDETAGVWVPEGEGTVDGPLFVAEVTHFTWWNADRPLGETHCVDGTLLLPGGAPAAGVTVNTTGVDYLGADFVITESDGSFCAPVKAGATSRLSSVVGGTGVFSWQVDVEAPAAPATCGGACIELGAIELADLEDDGDGDGVTELAGDCDDADPLVNPLAIDPSVDGVDQDCDGLDGPDADSDGAAALLAGGIDCDDGDPSVRPGLPEVCNGKDDDCDGLVDPPGSVGATPTFADVDGDGSGDPLSFLLRCDLPAGWVANGDDCDDLDPFRAPDLPEVCLHPVLGAGVDEDCDGLVDESGADGETFWVDADADGFGDASSSLVACQLPPGAADEPGDCDDGTPAVFPGAVEVCNGVDDDCDQFADEAGATGEVPFYADLDGDGFGNTASVVWACAVPSAAAVVGGDCDDVNPSVYPGAPESCSSNQDLNCDGAVQFEDNDGDGAPACTDCDDGDPGIFPGATEACDAVDTDCDGDLVDFFADTDGDLLPDCIDADDDGDGDPDASDCAPGDPTVYAGAVETCDSIDSDCDGSIVDGFADLDLDSYPDCVDPDDDGDGDPDVTDCGPLDPSIYTGAPEACDGIDNDCDGVADACAGANADGVVYGEVASWQVGQAVARGDLDGDGLDDLVVGSPTGGPNGAGAVYAFMGSPSGALLPSQADAAVLGVDGGDQAGSALAADCDLNGDGQDDLVVGAWSADPTGPSSGAVYVVFGPVTGAVSLATADVVLEGESAGDWAGWAVACAGDTNGDGVDDLLVGAWREDEATLDAGAAYLFLGPLLPGTTASLGAADAKILGEAAFDYAGSALSGAGDVNGDGFDDVLVGAWGHDDPSPTTGAAYLLLGPLSGTVGLGSADARLLGVDPGERAGSMVAAAGDVDGDGFGDLLVGAWSSDIGGTNAGAAYLVFGPVTGDISLALADSVITGLAPGDELGTSGSAAGDLDGDGFGDVLLGAPGRDAGGVDAGTVYVLLGSPAGLTGLAQARASLPGAGPSEQAGASLLGGADFDGDGIPDVLVGAPYADLLTNDGGAAYLQLGTSLLGP